MCWLFFICLQAGFTGLKLCAPQENEAVLCPHTHSAKNQLDFSALMVDCWISSKFLSTITSNTLNMCIKMPETGTKSHSKGTEMRLHEPGQFTLKPELLNSMLHCPIFFYRAGKILFLDPTINNMEPDHVSLTLILPPISYETWVSNLISLVLIPPACLKRNLLLSC